MLKVRRQLAFTLILVAWPAGSLFAQSQPSPQQSPPPQPPQTQSQPQTQPTTGADEKPDSIAEAARKAKAKKTAAAQGKVFTEDDLSGKKGGVSVVGNDNKKTRRARTTDPDGDYNPNGEEYWRSRSQPILDEIAATDQQIEQLKEDIKKYGNGGFDVQTGMKDNIAYIHDRNGQIQTLQKRKEDLKKQLDDLEEEGRKAGAQPAWFR
jgi:chromosome segregation ATPase